MVAFPVLVGDIGGTNAATGSAIAVPGPTEIPAPGAGEGETVLLATVTPPPSLDPAEPVRLAAKLDYLVCERECVPGSAELSLTLPVAPAAAAAGVPRSGASLPFSSSNSRSSR